MKEIKKGLVIVLLAAGFLSAAVTEILVYGSAGSVNLPPFGIFENAVYKMPTEGQSFFIFSNVELNGERHDGSIFALFSDIKIEGEVKGDLITLYSRTQAQRDKVSGLFISPSVFLTKIIIALFKTALLIIIVSYNQSFCEQGEGALANGKKAVLRAGLSVYFLISALCFVFFIAVVTYPVSALIVVLTAAATQIGMAPLSLYIGRRAVGSVWRHGSNNGIAAGLFANITAGGIIIQCLTFIPYFGGLFSYVLLPVICVGVLSVSALNWFVYKKFYKTPYQEADNNNDIIKGIITEGL